ncbi:MAG: purine-nucleoside phosphorylase, partial [Clostridia bacterium]|nr:purine-nucleoside phosphorylase [Clostridia bacterium]
VLSTGIKGGKRILVMSGRFHAYEGHPMEDVTLPVRVMAKLGVKKLIVTNAAGAVNTAFYPGDLMLITDFINLSGMNPLIGKNLSEFGPRFPDMSNAFDKELRKLALDCANDMGLKLQQGVYTWMSGPCYETPAEIRMVRTLGGDAVGMSTVPETIVANHSGIKVLGISCCTNMAAGVLDQPINHQEVMEMGLKARDSFAALVTAVIEKM